MKYYDKIIDTACGSSGFTVHSIFKVWKNIREEKGLPEGEGFTAAQRIPEETNFVRDNVFAIDFDEKTVRVARQAAAKCGILRHFVPSLQICIFDTAKRCKVRIAKSVKVGSPY